MIKKHMMKNFGLSLCLWGLMGLALPGQGFSAPHRIKAEPSKPDTQLAGVLIALTKADKTRDVVAMELQDAEPPLAWTPRDQTYVDFLNTVKTRPDVLAAAQAAHITIRKWDIRL